MSSIEINQLSKLGLGSSQIASLGRTLSLEYFVKMLKLAHESGINVIDTADTYGSGDAERLIGAALQHTKLPFFIISKAGFPHLQLPALFSPLNQVGKKIMQKLHFRKRFDERYLIRQAKSSGKRLGIKRLDAFLLHEPVLEELDNTGCWHTLRKIRDMGYAHYVGVSTNDMAVVMEGINSNSIQLVQTSYHVEAAAAIIGFCNEKNVPVIVNQVVQPAAGNIEEQLASAAADHRIKTLLTGTTNIDHLQQNIAIVKSSNHALYVVRDDS